MWNTTIWAAQLHFELSNVVNGQRQKFKKLLTLNKAQENLWAIYGPIAVKLLIGRWSSNAFLRYIRIQIEQFSHNVSRWMLIFMSHRQMEPDACHIWTHANRTTQITPRQGEILVATWLAEFSFQLLLSLCERFLMTISGGSTSCRLGLG